MTDSKRVANRWDNSEWAGGVPKDYWSHHPIIDAYINSNIIPFSGNMLEWLFKNFLGEKPLERGLSLCCGLGVGDRQALKAGICNNLDGFDLSPASIKAAQKEAENAGLGDRTRYWIDDANTIVLEENRYDIALSFGALHHIKELEHMCSQLRRALKPDSYIFLNEFTGPAHMQYTAQQLDIINRVMAVLPPSWRRTQQVNPVPLQSMVESDPSEAVRSDEIISIMCDNFELVDYCDYGGALLMPLWGMGIIPDLFINDRAADKQVIIKLLILIDELTAEHNIAPSNYSQLVLRNRPSMRGQTVSRRFSVNSPDRNQWVEKWLQGTLFADPAIALQRRLYVRARQVFMQHGFRGLAHKVGNRLTEKIKGLTGK